MPKGVFTAMYIWYFPTMQFAAGVMPTVTALSTVSVTRPPQELWRSLVVNTGMWVPLLYWGLEPGRTVGE